MPILRSTNTNLGQQTLHELGVPLDAVDRFGQTSAMIASDKGDIEMVKLLHDMKADLPLCDQLGCTAMHLAIRGGHTKLVEVRFYAC